MRLSSDLWNHSSTTLTANPRFFRVEDRARQERLADLSMQPFAPTSADLESGRQPFRELYHFLVEVRHADLESVRHREFVGVHEELIRQRGADFQYLERAEFVAALHFGCQVGPRLKDAVACALRQQPRPEQAVDFVSRQDGKHVLIALETIFDIQRIHAALQRFLAGQVAYAAVDAGPEPLRQPSPVRSVLHAEMAIVATEELVRSLADQRHLDVLSCPFAYEIHRDDGRSRDRLLEHRDDLRQRRLEGLPAERYRACCGTKRARRSPLRRSARRPCRRPCRIRRCTWAMRRRRGASSRAAVRSRRRRSAKGQRERR